MLSSDEHSGLFTFIFGLVVVVFAGIGLSIAVDHRFSFFATVSALKADVKNNESELERLEETHRERSWNLTELEPKRKTADAAMKSLQKRAADLGRRGKILISERESLRKSIPVLEEEFSRYRVKYRESIRNAAAGESLGTLVTLAGREYRDVFILRVTDAGLEIRHEHGRARLQASELDASFWNRFQWDREANQVRVAQENPAPDEVAAKSNEVRSDTVLPQPAKAGPDAAKIASQRAKVIAWKARVSQLRTERYTALNASSGSRTSPPGSLETWQARAGRLGVELAKAEAELTAAKAVLASISPNDALLKPNPYER